MTWKFSLKYENGKTFALISWNNRKTKLAHKPHHMWKKKVYPAWLANETPVDALEYSPYLHESKSISEQIKTERECWLFSRYQGSYLDWMRRVGRKDRFCERTIMNSSPRQRANTQCTVQHPPKSAVKGTYLKSVEEMKTKTVELLKEVHVLWKRESCLKRYSFALDAFFSLQFVLMGGRSMLNGIQISCEFVRNKSHFLHPFCYLIIKSCMYVYRFFLKNYFN